VCEDCGGYARDVGRISLRGLCAACGDRRNVEAREQLQARSGPAWDRYVAGLEMLAERLREPAG